MAVQVNESAIAFLSEKIADGAFVSESSWPDDRPANEEEISYIEEHGWNGFAKWHLALDTQASQFSKRRYEHLAGDFETVHRSALMAAHAKAVKLGFDQVKAAAETLVTELDEAAGGPPESTAKPEAEASPEASSEAPTETSAEAAEEPPEEAPTEPPEEAPTESPTEAPTEAPKEAPTEPPTEAPTESPTEPPTETSAEAPTEPPKEPTNGTADTAEASADPEAAEQRDDA